MELHVHCADGVWGLVVERFREHLAACGFSTSRAGLQAWGDVRLGNERVWATLGHAIDAHLAMSAYTSAERETVVVAFTRLFLSTARAGELAVRESSLDIAVVGGFAAFAWESARTTEVPRIAFGEPAGSTDAEGRMMVTPRLHFVARSVLGEPGVPDPAAWAGGVGASLRVLEGRGVVYDCGWSAWCAGRGIALDW